MKVTINGAVLLNRPDWPDVDFAVTQSRDGLVAGIERVGEPKAALPEEFESLPEGDEDEDD